MAKPGNHTSPVDSFLQEEVYRLGSSPGLRSLPPSPTRDFLLLTWGPIVYRTCYEPDTKRLVQTFLRCLNDAISSSIRQTLSGSDEQLRRLEKTYTSKLFSVKAKYDGIDEDGVRNAFHNYKVSLEIPATDLPSRLRLCLMVDKQVLSQLTGTLNKAGKVRKNADMGRCWVKVVEENFPDDRFGDQPYIATMDTHHEPDGTGGGDDEGYDGWSMVALSALVEVFDGFRQGRCLIEYHCRGRVYQGGGKWSGV